MSSEGQASMSLDRQWAVLFTQRLQEEGRCQRLHRTASVGSHDCLQTMGHNTDTSSDRNRPKWAQTVPPCLAGNSPRAKDLESFSRFGSLPRGAQLRCSCQQRQITAGRHPARIVASFQSARCARVKRLSTFRSRPRIRSSPGF